MAYKVVSTFDPNKLADNRYTLIFENMRNSGVDVDILPKVDPKNLEGILSMFKKRLDGAEMVFHIPEFTHNQLYSAYDIDFRKWVREMDSIGHRWTSDEYDELQTTRRDREKEFKHKLNSHIGSLKVSGTILDADVFIKELEEAYTTLDEIGLPRIKRMTVDEWEADKFFPAVFKKRYTSGGQGIYFLENDDQFRKLFDPKYIIGDINSTSGRYSDSGDYFGISEFIECPSDHYTHYRVFTLGDGTILGTVLSYSAFRKSEDERIAFDDINTWNVYDDVKSPLFLNRKKIVSNKGNGGFQIPLNPNKASREITDYERALLEEHGIANQQTPARLVHQASHAAKTFGKKGLYISGQDWIQGKDGNCYCIEINKFPQLGVFDTLYNRGTGNNDKIQRIAAEKIADNILVDFQRKRA